LDRRFLEAVARAFVPAHLGGKNKNAAKMGHPGIVIGSTPDGIVNPILSAKNAERMGQHHAQDKEGILAGCLFPTLVKERTEGLACK
jgi:hypothetical protein